MGQQTMHPQQKQLLSWPSLTNIATTIQNIDKSGNMSLPQSFHSEGEKISVGFTLATSQSKDCENYCITLD